MMKNPFLKHFTTIFGLIVLAPSTMYSMPHAKRSSTTNKAPICLLPQEILEQISNKTLLSLQAFLCPELDTIYKSRHQKESLAACKNSMQLKIEEMLTKLHLDPDYVAIISNPHEYDLTQAWLIGSILIQQEILAEILYYHSAVQINNQSHIADTHFSEQTLHSVWSKFIKAQNLDWQELSSALFLEPTLISYNTQQNLFLLIELGIHRFHLMLQEFCKQAYRKNFLTFYNYSALGLSRKRLIGVLEAQRHNLNFCLIPLIIKEKYVNNPIVEQLNQNLHHLALLTSLLIRCEYDISKLNNINYTTNFLTKPIEH